MGLLQENKSRNKISNDPNNTKWTRDTTTFGQKILRSQGWQPGQFLGAQDAPHAALHSAASASYIRVVLKDDMKGLGFSKAKEDEITGLDVFSDVLSRLNGKSEAAVEEDQQARLSVKTNRYVEMRWGPMRFVRGGLLVGDKLKSEDGVEESDDDDDDSSSAAEAKDAKAKTSESETKKAKKEKKSKKRKAAEEEESDSDSEATVVAGKKEKKRLRKDEDEDAKKKRKREKKEKKEKKSKKAAKDESDDSTAEDDDEKAARKTAKKLKKREKRERKEEKKRRKAAKAASKRDSDDSDTNSSGSEDDETTTTGTGVSTPAAGSGTSTPMSMRNFSRSRIIAQKRRAVMDATALKQIFMVKA